jgi:RNA polymerase sigma-70 factor, ECF subfamily
VTHNPQQPADEDVRQRLQQGQFREAFELLLALYKEKVFHLSISMLRNVTQAEDMTQDIFVKIWKGLPNYTGQASLSTWIYVISRNSCLTELKKRASHPTVSLQDPEFEDAAESLPSLHSTELESGAALDIGHLLAQLPEKYRQVIVLFYLEQKSYEDTATLLGIPLGTVKTFLHRARRELLSISRRRNLVPARNSTSYEPC